MSVVLISVLWVISNLNNCSHKIIDGLFSAQSINFDKFNNTCLDLLVGAY